MYKWRKKERCADFENRIKFYRFPDQFFFQKRPIIMIERESILFLSPRTRADISKVYNNAIRKRFILYEQIDIIKRQTNINGAIKVR